MANIMSSFKLHNKPSRNGFDLSNRHSFTAKIGELLPVQVKECLPGDKFNINLTHFSRTKPLTSPAYIRIKEYYDFCFVPTRLLWRYFDQFVNQMPNNVSSDSVSSEALNFTRHPYMLTSSLWHYLETLGHDQETFVDEENFPKYETTCKLLQYLGYGDFQSGLKNVALNPFPLLAYQKIYCDIFRFDQWELPLPHTFNIDFIDGTTPLGMVLSLSDLEDDNYIDMFNMRYANYPKDLIMGTMPNSQFGDVSLVATSNGITSLNSLKNSGTDARINPIYVNSESTASLGIALNSKQRLDQFFNFSILALRQAEFLQKWKEVAQSAKQDYRDQIKAHWNVNVSKARSGLTEYLGGITSNVQIDGAINNNLTDGATIIKGTAISGSRGNIEFEAPEHGILMCIYHAAPILDYNASFLYDPLVLKTAPTDYAIPELDQTGMQLVPDEFVDKRLSGDQDSYLGYAPRYIDYKTDIDKTFGSFNTTERNWVAPFEMIDGIVLYNNYLRFKVNPRLFDEVFAVAVNGNVSTDQLLCNADFNIKVVRNLDVNGMPY